jgi:hypothetical protein
MISLDIMNRKVYMDSDYVEHLRFNEKDWDYTISIFYLDGRFSICKYSKFPYGKKIKLSKVVQIEWIGDPNCTSLREEMDINPDATYFNSIGREFYLIEDPSLFENIFKTIDINLSKVGSYYKYEPYNFAGNPRNFTGIRFIQYGNANLGMLTMYAKNTSKVAPMWYFDEANLRTESGYFKEVNVISGRAVMVNPKKNRRILAGLRGPNSPSFYVSDEHINPNYVLGYVRPIPNTRNSMFARTYIFGEKFNKGFPFPIISSQEYKIVLGLLRNRYLNESPILSELFKLMYGGGHDSKNYNSFDIQFLNIDPEKKTITYLTGDRFIKCIDRNEDYYKSSLRHSSKIGKFIRKFISRPELTDAIVEKMSHCIVSAIEYKNEEGLRVVTGDEIPMYYLQSFYEEGKGTLNKSCMRYDNCTSRLSFYAINSHKCSMLVYFNSDGKVRARALLWETDKGKMMDRIYYTKESYFETVRNWARDNGYDYLYDYRYINGSRDLNSSDEEGEEVASKYLNQIKMLVEVSDLKFPEEVISSSLKNFNARSTSGPLPYMDSFYQVDLSNKKLRNGNEDMLLSFPNYSGNVLKICEKKDRYFPETEVEQCSISGRWLHKDYLVYIDKDSIYAHKGWYNIDYFKKDIFGDLYYKDALVHSYYYMGCILKEKSTKTKSGDWVLLTDLDTYYLSEHVERKLKLQLLSFLLCDPAINYITIETATTRGLDIYDENENSLSIIWNEDSDLKPFLKVSLAKDSSHSTVSREAEPTDSFTMEDLEHFMSSVLDRVVEVRSEQVIGEVIQNRTNNVQL